MTVMFVGLGVMGTPMARNLAKAERALALYDVNLEHVAELAEELGAQVVSDLTALPDGVDTVVLMLPTTKIVESVLEGEQGLFATLPTGSLIIDMGSSEPASTVRLSEEARRRGLGYVDAPVSGGIVRAISGELAIMIGASDQTSVERALPLLATMGGEVIVAGGPGSGHAAKALNNLLGAINLTGAAEVMTVATKFGIQPSVMLDILNASTGRNQATEFKFPTHILPGTYASRFAMDLMIKDIGIALALAGELSIGLPLAESVAEIACEARATAGDGADHTEIVRHYEVTNAIRIGEGVKK